jgi:hypothetical protein
MRCVGRKTGVADTFFTICAPLPTSTKSLRDQAITATSQNHSSTSISLFCQKLLPLPLQSPSGRLADPGLGSALKVQFKVGSKFPSPAINNWPGIFQASRILIITSTPLIMKTNNKRKLSKAPGGQTKRQKTQTGNSKPKRPVSVDALSWKTVDVPEMFDDAEGFYGLEVVEGVDIVNKDGTVQFVSLTFWS